MYTATNNGAVRRFRTPGPNDVLSGRGGSVNAHSGNCQFREFVQERKHEYNFASKEKKVEICREVIAKVTELGGRFLGKDSTNMWWVEQPDERVMAKTSQALREGAPKMRQQNIKRDLTPTAKRAAKRVRVNYQGHTVLPNQASPPIAPLSAPSAPIESLNLAAPGVHAAPIMPSQRSIARTHSLALSDVSLGSIGDFVNPFVEEEDRCNATFDVLCNATLGDINTATNAAPSSSMEAPQQTPPKPLRMPSIGSVSIPRVGVSRDTSMSSIASDMGGIGALIMDSSDRYADFDWNLRPVSP